MIEELRWIIRNGEKILQAYDGFVWFDVEISKAITLDKEGS